MYYYSCNTAASDFCQPRTQLVLYILFAEASAFSVGHFQLHIINNVYKIFKLYHEIHI